MVEVSGRDVPAQSRLAILSKTCRMLKLCRGLLQVPLLAELGWQLLSPLPFLKTVLVLDDAMVRRGASNQRVLALRHHTLPLPNQVPSEPRHRPTGSSTLGPSLAKLLQPPVYPSRRLTGPQPSFNTITTNKRISSKRYPIS